MYFAHLNECIRTPVISCLFCLQLFTLGSRVSALHIYTKYLLVLVYSYIFIFANTLLFAQRCESQFRPIESFVLNGCELRVI